jgi:bifunctional non-homologous end joining protein LigD
MRFSASHTRRRAELEALALNGPYWTTPETFDDGPALFEAVCGHELEGVDAKRRAAATGQATAAG